MRTKPDDLSKYIGIVANVRIDHRAYSDAVNELKAAYDSVGKTSSPVCLLITGESRTGKSSVVRELLESHVPSKIDDQVIRTVVYAVAPAKATVKSLLESLLKGLGDPHWSRGTESNMTQRLYTLLDAVQCRMIILDEFQHLCDKGQIKKLDFISDWLKVLLESKKYGLVAVGLPAAASVVHNHSQLTGRFDDELRLPLFNWQNAESVAQFRAILQQFQKELSPFEFPQLSSREMAMRFYLASAGRIGLVAKLLERAVHDAIRAGRLEVSTDDLSRAYKRCIWSARLFPVAGGPFGAELDGLTAAGVQDAVLSNAAMEAVADTSASVEVVRNGARSPKTVAAAPAKSVARPDAQGLESGRKTRRSLARELKKAL